jgi:hypothetical protein
MHIINVIMRCYKFYQDGTNDEAGPQREPTTSPKPEPVETMEGEVAHLLLSHGAKFSNKPFNTQAFCIVMGWSAFVVGPLALTVIAYSEMPLKLLTLLAIFSTSSRFSSSSSLCLLPTRSLC